MKKALGLLSEVVLFVILSMSSSFAGEKVFFYHTDSAGSPLAITDDKGNVVWRETYKPFGEDYQITGTIENNNRFIGKEKDKETGLIYDNHRYYVPVIGRFGSPDPMSPVDPWTSKTNYEMLLNPQKLNRYAYGLNNPCRYIDPDGKAAVDVSGYYTTRQQFIGRYLNWAPTWLQEIVAPSSPSFDIGPMVIESGGSRFIGKGLNEAFEIAKAGGRNAGLLKTYYGKTAVEIEKGIQSLEARVSEHVAKIANPSEFAADWGVRNPQAQEGLLKYWQKEVAKYKEQANVLRGLLKEKIGE